MDIPLLLMQIVSRAWKQQIIELNFFALPE
jgi:hypothetical protein